MKHFRQILAALALACALTLSAPTSAGDISCGATQNVVCSNSTTPGGETDVQDTPTDQTEETTDVVLETALIIWQNAMSLF